MFLFLSASGEQIPALDQTASVNPNPQIQLLPPIQTTDLPQFTAPIIVPTMNAGKTVSSATNPMSGCLVASDVPCNGDEELQIPDFDDDEQMYHYTVSRLQRALKDCHGCAVDVSQYHINYSFASCHRGIYHWQ